ncbi:MAG: hypothetical protein K6B14_11910 [Lachnospiraceae bacterium]|nr:hypothetical protein [Lachnospiraceae bacterium]
MKKLLLLGDSNTYGYDPRDMFGGRYPASVRWTSALRKELAGEYEITDEGQNGRKLPRFPYEADVVGRMIAFLEEGDAFVVMLGTNDLLLNAHPRPKDAIDKMKDLIEWTQKSTKGVRFIVIGPAYFSARLDGTGELRQASIEMNEGFEALCSDAGVEYHDAGKWAIEFAADGVHFSETGHKMFFERFRDVIKESH